MIILEGPDNSGKSTLAAKLKRDTGLPVIHSVKPKEDMSSIQVYHHCLNQVAPKDTLSILDRVTAISESIYGPICRGKSALGMYQKDALLDIWQRPYTIIYCRPDDETILENGGRPQMPGVLENHKRIIDAYDTFMDDLMRFGCPLVFWYDWKDRLAYNSVLNLANEDKRRYMSIVQSTTFLSM